MYKHTRFALPPEKEANNTPAERKRERKEERLKREGKTIESIIKKVNSLCQYEFVWVKNRRTISLFINNHIHWFIVLNRSQVFI